MEIMSIFPTLAKFSLCLKLTWKSRENRHKSNWSKVRSNERRRNKKRS